MNLRFIIILCFTSLVSCIEPIDFDTSSEPSRLVVQGYISNIAAKDRLVFQPESGYFKVKLGLSSPVTNERDQTIDAAIVSVVNDLGESLDFTPLGAGNYELVNDEFKALPERSYFLRVVLPDGKIYESIPESVALSEPGGCAEYRVDSRFRISDQNNATEELKGISVSSTLPENQENKPFYYYWEITPSWVFKAALLPENSIRKTCWVTNKYFFDDIVLQRDANGQGGYPKDLFFVEVPNNPRIQHDFTVLIKQFSLSKRAFEFREDIKKQNESVGSIFDPPPFSIRGNLVNINDADDRVLGYFSVVGETAQRWFTSHSELPYSFDDSRPCNPPPGVPNIPTPDCLSCFEYGGGSSFITNEEPNWWR